MEQSTIVAISTALGSSAIGVVRLSGASAHAIAGEMFRPTNPAKPNGYEARFGVLYDKIGPIDEAIALYFIAPNSYTGENVVEFSCHGNPQLLSRVVDAAIELGAQQAVAGEFSRRAFMNGKLSPAKAEAVSALISTEGRRSTAAASNALCGVLGRELSGYSDELLNIASAVAAACDYPEDTDLNTQPLISRLQKVKDKLKKLSHNAMLVQELESGIKTVIIGRPNAGKSTVLNLLCGYDRAIVSPVAGTTRDIVKQSVELSDYRLTLCDTAGLHETDDAIELEGIKRSHASLGEAQLAILVLDATLPFDSELYNLVRGIKTVAVVNKIDIANKIKPSELNGFDNVVEVSAINSDHRERLIEAITSTLPQLPQEDIIPISNRQATAAATAGIELDEAIECLNMGIVDAASVKLEDAYSAVCEMLLLNPTDEIVNAIFSNFCIGK